MYYIETLFFLVTISDKPDLQMNECQINEVLVKLIFCFNLNVETYLSGEEEGLGGDVFEEDTVFVDHLIEVLGLVQGCLEDAVLTLQHIQLQITLQIVHQEHQAVAQSPHFLRPPAPSQIHRFTAAIWHFLL